MRRKLLTDAEVDAIVARFHADAVRRRELMLREVDNFFLLQRCTSNAEYQRRVKDLP